jgi:hypothetical protein
MRATKIGLLGAALLMAPVTARGQDAAELVSDRPDFTESAVAVAPGRVQLEAGVTTTRDEGESARELGEVLVRVGMTEGLELRLGLGSWVDAGEAEGWDGGSLGLKAQLLESWGRRPALAVLIGTSTPLGDEEVADESWQPEAKLALGWELGEALELGVNAGYARPGEGETRFDQAQWSAALGWGATERLGFFLEAFGFDQEAPEGEATSYLDAGATWLVGPDLQLDVRFGRGLNDEAADWFAGTGVVARW